MRIGIIRTTLQRQLITGDCVVELAGFFKYIAQIVQNFWRIGAGGQGGAVKENRLIALAKMMQRIGEIILRFGKVRPKPDRIAKVISRRRGLSKPLVCCTEIIP